MRLSSHMVMYMSMIMKMWPTDNPLKILRLYCPVSTIVSMDCTHTRSSQTNDTHAVVRQTIHIVQGSTQGPLADR